VVTVSHGITGGAVPNRSKASLFATARLLTRLIYRQLSIHAGLVAKSGENFSCLFYTLNYNDGVSQTALLLEFGMPGTGVGIFWIDMMCKPCTKELLKHPLVLLIMVSLLYGFIAYMVLKSAYLTENQ